MFVSVAPKYRIMSSVQKAPTLKFYCSVCGQKLAVPKGLQGQKFTCPNCSTKGHVPGARPRKEGGETVKFNCMGCGQRLSAPKKALGNEIDCPVCSERTLVRNGVTGPSSPLSARPLRKKVEREKKSPEETEKEQKRAKIRAERRIAELRQSSAKAREDATEDSENKSPKTKLDRVNPVMESSEAVDGSGPDWKVVRPQEQNGGSPSPGTTENSPEYSDMSIVSDCMSQKPRSSRTESGEQSEPDRVTDERSDSATPKKATKVNGTRVNGHSTPPEEATDELFQSLLQSGFQVESVSRDSDES